jgi:hypothetical protein
MKTITRNPDGSVTVQITGTQKDDKGNDVPCATIWQLQPLQIDAHRRDPTFIDNTADAPTLAALNSDKATRAAAAAKGE